MAAVLAAKLPAGAQHMNEKDSTSVSVVITVDLTMKIGADTIAGASVLASGPRFLTTMQIPILAGREIDDRDQPGSTPVAVIGERLPRTSFGNRNPLGPRIPSLD